MIAQNVLSQGLAPDVCLNVNIPNCRLEDIQGIRICRQNKGVWREEYDKRLDPNNHEYYWLTGKLHNLEPEAEDTDEWALHHKYISIVPVHVDLTAYHHLTGLKGWNWEIGKFENV